MQAKPAKAPIADLPIFREGWLAGVPEPLLVVLQFASREGLICETLSRRVLMEADAGANELLRPFHCTRHSSVSVCEIILDRREEPLTAQRCCRRPVLEGLIQKIRLTYAAGAVLLSGNRCVAVIIFLWPMALIYGRFVGPSVIDLGHAATSEFLHAASVGTSLVVAASLHFSKG